jgi:two-component system, chemotaxis family, sensor histidine kinase and response regulator WspE
MSQRPTMSGKISMSDLCRIEVEGQSAILTETLLALEKNPKAPANYETLMRAAHSIKGAARIVSHDNLVRVAHIMEDYFVGVQAGRVAFASPHVDVLLRAVDVMQRLSRGEEADIAQTAADLVSLSVGQAPPPVRPASPLLPVFRTELETHCNALRTELVTTRKPEALRASLDAIRGSARLMRLEPLANFAATAAERVQQGVELLIDPLTRATDLLLSLAKAEDPQAWVEAHAAKLLECGGHAAAVPPPRPPQSTIVAKAPEKPQQQPSNKPREIRITADKLDRLMAASGETTVAARWFERYAQSLARIKAQHDELLAALEQLTERHPDLMDVHSMAIHARAVLLQRLEEADTFAGRLETLSGRLAREVIATRMRPFGAVVHPFPRLVRDLARTLGKSVELQVEGATTDVDRDILEKLEAPLTQLLRNAMDHGIETPQQRAAAGKPAEARLRLAASHQNGMLHVIVEDDGRGIDPEEIRARVLQRRLAGADIAARLTESELFEFLFLPGFTTAAKVTEISGRGVGLDVVQSMLQEVGGVVRVSSKPGRGTTFILQLPITRSVMRSLLIEIDGEPYAVPLTRIERALVVPRDELRVTQNREYVDAGGASIGIIPARQLLGLRPAVIGDAVPILVIANQRNRYGLVVDRFIGESDLALRPLDPRLGKVPNISAASVTLDGAPILMLDVDDVITSVDELLGCGGLRRILAEKAKETAAAARRKRILVVDDSLTVREVERRLLENQGYEVDVAVDGMHGWNAVRAGEFDLVITDVDMPRMTGIELVTRIKQDPQLAKLPVVIVSYKDREEERLRGLDAGANYYLTKSSFQDDKLLRAVADLIGPAVGQAILPVSPTDRQDCLSYNPERRS